MTLEHLWDDDGGMDSPAYFSYQGLPAWQIRILKDYPRIYLEPDPRTIDDLRN